MLKQILIPFIACLTLVGCDTSNKVDVESTETETTSEVCEIETDTETKKKKHIKKLNTISIITIQYANVRKY